MKTLLTSLMIFVASLCVSAAGNRCADGYGRIANDTFWDAADGSPLYSQGGGIFRFRDPETDSMKYYWYGVHYREAEIYREDPSVTLKDNHFAGVTCYSSSDLVNWTPENVVLTPKEVSTQGSVGWVGRMGVAWLPSDSIYAMFIQHNGRVLVATSDTPAGDYRCSHEIDMTSRIGTSNTGDQTVFTDPDTGLSYLIYSYGRGRHRQYVSLIGMKNGRPDLLDCHEVCSGASREGNCMFKHDGKYYMVASNIYGWDGSLTYYVMSDSIYGPYLPANDMAVMKGSCDDYSHVSQTGFFYTLEGSDCTTVIFCGDRWAEFAGNGLGYNQWMPLSFEGDTPVLNSLSAWELNAITGDWRVAHDNNYVKNGSFEADRRTVPLAVKPRQDALTGWHTEVIEGNRVIVDHPDSPQLNYFNSVADRHVVIGEKSMRISDKIPFKRRVTQSITSTSSVPLPDGHYTLTAMVNLTEGFRELYIYVDSEGIVTRKDISVPTGGWHRVELTGIPVGGGHATVGIYADRAAAASCLMDDIAFTRVGQ